MRVFPAKSFLATQALLGSTTSTKWVLPEIHLGVDPCSHTSPLPPCALSVSSRTAAVRYKTCYVLSSSGVNTCQTCCCRFVPYLSTTREKQREERGMRAGPRNTHALCAMAQRSRDSNFAASASRLADRVTGVRSNPGLSQPDKSRWDFYSIRRSRDNTKLPHPVNALYTPRRMQYSKSAARSIFHRNGRSQNSLCSG